MRHVVLAGASLVLLGAAGAAAERPAFTRAQPELFTQRSPVTVAFGDYDNDGWPDMFVGYAGGHVRLFRNDHGRFVDVTAASGIDDAGQVRAAAWGDYDHDGFLDLYVGFDGAEKKPNRLYHNDGHGHFVDRAQELGVAEIGDSRQVSFVDYDNDGQMDLLVCFRNKPNRLYHQEKGRFRDVAERMGITGLQSTVGAIWFDYNEDGRLDLFLANQNGKPNRVYRNDGDRFTDVAPELGVSGAGRARTQGSVGLAAADYDRDGRIDVFYANYGPSWLLHNDGGGRFHDAADEMKMKVDSHLVSAAWGDYDNDGWPDLYTDGYLQGHPRVRDYLFHHERDHFSDVTPANVLEHDADHCVNWVDTRRNGQVDLILCDHGPDGWLSLYQNARPPGQGAGAVEILVLDADGKYAKAGSEVRVYAAGTRRVLGARLVDTGSGYCSQSALPVHVGLGAERNVDVEVTSMSAEGRIVTRVAGVDVAALRGAPLTVRTRGTEILWDKFGVPHVYAQDLSGVFFGYGYAQMQSHGNLILKLYGESRGRAAEYWGQGSADRYGFDNVDSDRWVRINGAPERAEAWYRQQSPEYQHYLAAFAAGMNRYAELHPEQLDPERRRVLPITPVDPLLHVHRIVHFHYLSSAGAVKAAALALKGDRTPAAGESNAWAIAPFHSATGHSMLLMNPHLPFGDWSTYYEAHLNAPGIHLYGASQVGFPMLRFAFSDFLGFTQTVNNIDASDLYRLQVASDGKGYRFDGVVRPFGVSEQTLRIRQPDGRLREERLVVRTSIHGPVVWDRDGLTLAIRTAALDRPNMIEQYWRMALARSFGEYEAQLKRLQVPSFYISYADRTGHIMCLYNGTLPRRGHGSSRYWAGIVPGDTSRELWTDILSYDELPKVIDPACGWVQNTNNPPWSTTYPGTLDPARFPPYLRDAGISFRTMRSLRMLTAPGKMSWESFVADKFSTRMELADRILDDLLRAADEQGDDRARAAAAVLRKWDRSAEADSRGALLFEAFALRFLGPELSDRSGFAVPGDWRQPLTTPRGLKAPAKALAMLDAAAAETIQRYGALDAPWGRFRRFAIGGTNIPGIGADGLLGAFRVTRFGPRSQAVQKANFGDTFVALVDFGSPVKASVLMTYGNASQPGSPHREDQLRLTAAKRLRPALLTRAEVEAQLESIDRF